MKVYKLFALLILSALFFGCATAPPLSKDVSQSLRGSKLAVVYAQSEKRIHYNELVYKVFWNETRTKDVSFNGLWDIDSDLSGYMTPKVCDLGLNAVSIYDAVSDKEIKDLHEALKSKTREEPLVLSDDLRAKLIDSEINYLITLNSDYIYVYSQVGVKQGHARAWMYVQDVRSNDQKYADFFPIGGNFKVEKSIREIEDNNLEGLRVAMKEWLDDSIPRWMPKKLGLAD